MKRNNLYLMLIVLAGFLTACGGAKSALKKKELPQKPEVFVFPFDCACSTIELSSKVTSGFIAELPSNVQPVDLEQFELFLATRNLSLDDIVPGAYISPSLPPDEKTDAVQKPTDPPLGPNYSSLVSDLFSKRAVREKFFKVTGIDYIAIGRAREKQLSALEAGNLVTVQTADIKLLDVKTGEVIVDDSFKQGVFEIIAPNRVGKKLADKVSDKFKKIAKEEKVQRKREKQRAKRRRILTD